MKHISRKYKRLWNLSYCILLYLLISIILYLLVKDLGLYAALVVAAISYQHMVLVIAMILRMRGDITEKSFISLVLAGFKITNLLKK